MHIRLDWSSLCVANVQTQPLTLKNVLTTYSDVFKKELGTLSLGSRSSYPLSLAVNHSSVEPDKFLMP